MAAGSVDVTYRGVFQKNLAGVITKELVRAARREGKIGGTVQRYGDSPERNGIPAKQFAVIAEDEDALRVEMTKYEPDNVVAVCVMDDTLTKGVESWAWYGVQPININLAPGGTLLVVSRRTPEELLRWIPRRDFDWNLAILPGDPSFGGLWVYHDDGTDYRTMGAVSRVTGGLVGLQSLVAQAESGPDAARRVGFLHEGYEAVQVHPVPAGVGAEDTYRPIDKPGWTEMREGLVVPAVKVGANNELFKKFTTRTARPLVKFDACVKCQICYTVCPDECFVPTPAGHYDVNYEHCCGCGICAQTCPVPGCIEMVDELVFESNQTVYELYERDPEAYEQMRQEKLAKAGGPIPHYGVL
ncbi:MAG TPA: 4Fe-4S dicluster-binding protein [Candidatus Dormibacteraeota bacterium]|nr:4Fe-4S dicluster-binding protein [Candidatus Dormibacteraeota bacterium]